MGVWNEAKDVASAIAKAGWGDNAKIGRAFSKEALSDLGSAARNSKMASAAGDILRNSAGLEEKQIAEAIKNLANEGGIEAFAQDISKYTAKTGREEAFGKAVEAFKKASEMSTEGVGITGLARGYFMDPVYGGARTKATLGAAVVGGVGIRYLQGGTLTEKPNGERDIAGIPFV